MIYDLRRLRLHGLIERIKGTHRCRVTPFGLRAALFITRAYARLLRPGLSHVIPSPLPSAPSRLRRVFDNLEAAMDHVVYQEALLAAP